MPWRCWKFAGYITQWNRTSKKKKLNRLCFCSSRCCRLPWRFYFDWCLLLIRLALFPKPNDEIEWRRMRWLFSLLKAFSHRWCSMVLVKRLLWALCACVCVNVFELITNENLILIVSFTFCDAFEIEFFFLFFYFKELKWKPRNLSIVEEVFVKCMGSHVSRIKFICSQFFFAFFFLFHFSRLIIFQTEYLINNEKKSMIVLR